MARPPFEPFEFVDASLRRPRSTQAASERHRGARRGRVAGGPGGESRESARARQKRRVSTVLRRVRGLADAPGRHARRGGRHGAIRDDSRLDRLRDAFRGRRRGSIAIGDVSRQSRVWRFRRSAEPRIRGAFPRVSDAAAPAFLFVRGLYGEHYPCYQWDAVEHFRRRGAVARLSAAARGAGTTAANASALCDEILAFADELGADGAGNQRRVVLVGHSKGGVDACAALALYEHRLADVVLGVITVQSPYGGSPIASDLTANETLRGVTTRALETLLRAPRGEGARTLLPPLLDVTYENRMAFLEHHPLPDRFPCVSFHTRTSSNNSVLALVAAHARKYVRRGKRRVSVRGVDAEVPGCVAVRWRAEFDHADGAYPRAMSDADGGMKRTERVFFQTKTKTLFRRHVWSHTPRHRRRRGFAKTKPREEARRRRRVRRRASRTRRRTRWSPGGGARARLTRDARRERRSTRRSTRRADGGVRGFSDLPGFSGEIEGVLTRLARDVRRARTANASATPRTVRRETPKRTTTTSGRRGEIRDAERTRVGAAARSGHAACSRVPRSERGRPRASGLDRGPGGDQRSARVAADGARRKQKRGRFRGVVTTSPGFRRETFRKSRR